MRGPQWARQVIKGLTINQINETFGLDIKEKEEALAMIDTIIQASAKPNRPEPGLGSK